MFYIDLDGLFNLAFISLLIGALGESLRRHNSTETRMFSLVCFGTLATTLVMVSLLAIHIYVMPSIRQMLG